VNSDKSDASEELFGTVGRYVILFQWLEGVVDQCLLLLWGHENLTAGQLRLAGMTNQQKVDALRREFHENPANARGRTRPDWIAWFETLIERLHQERRRRNSLLHSQYLFDLVEIGLPILQSDHRKQDGKGIFEQKYLTPEVQRVLQDDLAHLAFETGLAHRQLIADYRATMPDWPHDGTAAPRVPRT
jgi:hypothetical protein